MSGMAAAIRGLASRARQATSRYRVIARGSGGSPEGRSASPTCRVRAGHTTRGARPSARPHDASTGIDVMPTSTSDADFDVGGLDKEPQLSSAASAWADLVPELDLEACSTECDRNEDEEFFSIEIGTKDVRCAYYAACVKGLPAFHLGLELEGRIVGSGLRMVFVPDTDSCLRLTNGLTDPTEDREEVGDGRTLPLDRQGRGPRVRPYLWARRPRRETLGRQSTLRPQLLAVSWVD